VSRFCIVQDGDGHWYLVPAERTPEAMKMFEQAYQRWLADGHPMATLYPGWPPFFPIPSREKVADHDEETTE
jgi:hypothetical protein